MAEDEETKFRSEAAKLRAEGWLASRVESTNKSRSGDSVSREPSGAASSSAPAAAASGSVPMAVSSSSADGTKHHVVGWNDRWCVQRNLHQKVARPSNPLNPELVKSIVGMPCTTPHQINTRHGCNTHTHKACTTHKQHTATHKVVFEIRLGDSASGANCVVTSHALKRSEK